MIASGTKYFYKNPLHRISSERKGKYNKLQAKKATSNPISPVLRATGPVNHIWFMKGTNIPKDDTKAAIAAIPDGRRLGLFHAVTS